MLVNWVPSTSYLSSSGWFILASDRQEKAQCRKETFHFILCRVVPENTNLSLWSFLLGDLGKRDNHLSQWNMRIQNSHLLWGSIIFSQLFCTFETFPNEKLKTKDSHLSLFSSHFSINVSSSRQSSLKPPPLTHCQRMIVIKETVTGSFMHSQ